MSEEDVRLYYKIMHQNFDPMVDWVIRKKFFASQSFGALTLQDYVLSVILAHVLECFRKTDTGAGLTDKDLLYKTHAKKQHRKMAVNLALMYGLLVEENYDNGIGWIRNPDVEWPTDPFFTE